MKLYPFAICSERLELLAVVVLGIPRTRSNSIDILSVPVSERVRMKAKSLFLIELLIFVLFYIKIYSLLLLAANAPVQNE
jgi:hypothetical protein